MPEKVSCVEHSRSSTARCDQRLCMKKIAKGELRFGYNVNIMGNLTTKWRHVACCRGAQKPTYQVNENGGKRMMDKPDPSIPSLPDLENLYGFDGLADAEKEYLRRHIKNPELGLVAPPPTEEQPKKKARKVAPNSPVLEKPVENMEGVDVD